eukprot:5635739-Lingulodinium_polyedra.AAC.1
MEVHIAGDIESGHCPPWLRDVCRYRGAFEQTIVCFEPHGLGGGKQWMVFMYACQMPFYVMFLDLELLPQELAPAGCSDALLDRWLRNRWEYCFKKLNTYRSDQELPQERPDGL